MSEIAFLLMDLEHRRRADLGWRFLNAWLDATADYDGLRVLRHYVVYRAMVRAKVACLRGGAGARRHARDYLELAERVATAAPRPFLAITTGVSGSGKSWLAARVAARLGAVVLRSDVERRRAAGGAAPRYDAAAVRSVYRRLEKQAAVVLDAGYPVVIDATFLDRTRREHAAALAAEHRAPFVILAVEVPEPIARERIARRAARGGDPSEATAQVLARQLLARDPLTGPERERAVVVDAGADVEPEAVARALRARCRAPSDRRLDEHPPRTRKPRSSEETTP